MSETDPDAVEPGEAARGGSGNADAGSVPRTDGGTVPERPSTADGGPSRSVEPEGAAGLDESITVLHVDDDPQVGDLVTSFLERGEDVTVLTESDAGAALDRIATGEVDCVVSDVEMPGMDGLELASAVGGQHPEVPVLLFSSRSRAAVADAEGVAGYVEKGGDPQQLETLARRVWSALA